MKKKRTIIYISGLVWVFALVAGFKFLANYSYTPEADHASPVNWPVESQIHFDHARPALIMFAHPHCPCTRASIGELALLMASCKGRVTAIVLFIKPAAFTTEWAQSDLWESAAAIPGVTAVLDSGGNEARLFHANTSGLTVLYSEHGELLFHGGITSSRGHSGDNIGRDAIATFLRNGTLPEKKTPVFGCSLTTMDSCSIGDPVCTPKM